MTENKRFTIDENKIKDNQSPYCYIEYYKGLVPIVDLLNGLAEENQQLINDCSILVQSNQDYRKENEQLKQTIKEVLELLKEEVDLFSDKAIEHDIQAYIELGELDNKDAYYMAISTKKAIKLLREMIE